MSCKKSQKSKRISSNTELAYYVHTHKFDKAVKADLFHLNKITHEEKLENFTILLAGDDTNTSSSTICDLPSNDDVLDAMKDTKIICMSKNRQRSGLQVK